ncbi:hypothetical protein K438DRAFT_1764900 [Mycena galopus ATCC 62051]|nr:hypothetical protein K438DRAFT_1764900 [Mycena galopus ATCC 62051]
MPGGRKPLDPETKLQHRRLSSALYEAKNAGKRREGAKMRMRRHREAMSNADHHTRREYRAQVAEHSENYRRRKLEEELVNSRSAGAVKLRARKLDAEHLRASHQSAATPSLTPQPKPSCKRLPVARRASSSQEMPLPSSKRDGTSGDGSGEDSDASNAPYRQSDKPFFPARITPRTAVGRPCKACGLYDCPSCACMCEASSEWVEHPGGHFFPDCKKCGGLTVPGVHVYANIRRLLIFKTFVGKPLSHEDRFSHNTFFAIIHEDWMGVVTSDNTIVRMLNAYPKARTFRATTWSRFEELWNLDCTEYHEHPNAVPTPASKMPSPRNKGELPTEDARNRELVVKANIQRNLGRTRPPAVPIDAARADAMFTRVLGPQAAAPSLPALASRIAATSRAVAPNAAPMSVSELAEGFARRPGTVPISRRERVAVITALNRDSPSTAGLADAIAAMAIGESTPRISPDAELPERDWARNARTSPPILERAVAVLKATPGAALAFSSDEDELLHFLEEEDNELPALAEVDDNKMPALASG